MNILSLVAINKYEVLLMSGVEDYSYCGAQLIGGFPLEEASAQEWNPFVNGSLYGVSLPEGFDLIKEKNIAYIFWISCICVYFLGLTI